MIKYPLHYIFLCKISYTLQYVVLVAVKKYVECSCNESKILVLHLFGHFMCEYTQLYVCVCTYYKYAQWADGCIERNKAKEMELKI
jgi:hypothetical protein